MASDISARESSVRNVRGDIRRFHEQQDFLEDEIHDHLRLRGIVGVRMFEASRVCFCSQVIAMFVTLGCVPQTRIRLFCAGKLL